MRFTVFTPTYNRGYLIKNLYESLKKQSFYDFEWVVIDDCSTDNTSNVIKECINESFLKITYIKLTVNGGKHRAINRALDIAKGDLFFIVDSDDWLPNNSLEVIDYYEKTIPVSDKGSFCGVCGAKNESLNLTNDKYIDLTHIERSKIDSVGDRAEVFYTKVFRKYRFPEFKGETYMRESVVWNRMAHDGYKIRYFNDVIYNFKYLPDGLTKKSNSLYLANPKGIGLSLSEEIKFGLIEKRNKWNEYFKYYRNFKSALSNKVIAGNLRINYMIFIIGIFCYKIKRRVNFLFTKVFKKS